MDTAPFVDAADSIPADPTTITTTPVRRRRDANPLPSPSSDDVSNSSVVNPDDTAESATLSTPLEAFASLIVKAILFQTNLLINTFLFPLHLLRFFLRIAIDPLGTLKLVTLTAWDKLSSQIVFPKGAGNFAINLFWWWLRLLYVFVVLCGLLVAAFLSARAVIGRVVEEPVRAVRELSFDYTKTKPDAVVMVDQFDGVGVGNKMDVTVSLVLPESEYNKKLGMFQVRMEFLSASGKVLSTSSLPCMLRFKSSHMLLIETFLRSVPLLSGFSSEAQVITVKMSGFSGKTEPITCLRVVLEQRAEFSHGAGIPEIYSASAKLESELPFFKQIIWSWRRTLFMWITLMIFIFQLLAVLLCCWPTIIPTSRTRSR